MTSDLQSLHSLIISPSEMASPADVTDQLSPFSLSELGREPQWRVFLKFENSQKIEEKSYDCNFLTNVIRTKRAFLEAKKKKIGVRGTLNFVGC